MTPTMLLPRSARHTIYCWRALRHFLAAGIGMIHVPKSAGTSIAGRLFGRSLGHFTYSEYCRCLGPIQRFSPPLFALVREPEDRFLSAYRFFRQGRTSAAGVQLVHPRADLWKRDVDLFLTEYVEATPDHRRDYIFQTQTRFVTSFSNHLGLNVFRLDDMKTLKDWLSERLGGDISFPHENRSDSVFTAALTDAQRARIRSIYQADFELYETLKDHSHHP